jgi:Aminoglycoside-2''-adenylyltransferase
VTNNPDMILSGLNDAGVDFIVVGGFAAVMLGVPVLTHDVDIVHRRTDATLFSRGCSATEPTTNSTWRIASLLPAATPCSV